ncbi:hypothetical protein [Candidatus Thiodictyon syntrophicum]|jgi:hypothetical protein|uniref:Phospholipase n=1 Tax=Candidatus Thiodictyon syntrophicum TaxID=1166950 RepID=A0A2K8U6E1_9GAMM|nr:hypothetical protein [Candidatus Thiodictyon syntrophicum]AUB80979.1 hypothetical protein THSYN_08480 [Candidatus Thiodictyon syntrophicum]
MCKQQKVPAPARAPAIALIGVLAALLLPAGPAQAFKCVPLYGNWCGPGHPSAVALPPVDAFDAACMRHDLCIAGAWSETPCDRAFVDELHLIAAQTGYLPRPLQWAEYLIRVKAGGGWGGMPMPMPGDAMGIMSSVMTPCW